MTDYSILMISFTFIAYLLFAVLVYLLNVRLYKIRNLNRVMLIPILIGFIFGLVILSVALSS